MGSGPGSPGWLFVDPSATSAVKFAVTHNPLEMNDVVVYAVGMSGAYEATRVHDVAWERGGVAGDGARAAAWPDAPHRHSHGVCPRRPRRTRPGDGFHAGPATIGLDRWP